MEDVMTDSPSRTEIFIERRLASIRWLILIPVIVFVGSAILAFAYSTYLFCHTARELVHHPLPVTAHISGFLVVVDVSLIGATFLIAAIGFYELFLSRVDAPGLSRLPEWLEMSDLNDLKARVISMVVLVGAVTFIEILVTPHTGRSVLYAGIGVSLVISSLALYLRLGHHRNVTEE